MLGLSRRHYYEHRNRAGGRAANDGSGGGRGRSADSPSDIPKKGWKDILLRVWDEQSKDNVSMLAAGVAYYALLAIFPAIAALVSIYGLVADPAMIETQLNQLGSLLPPEALSIVSDQARKVATAPSQGLGFGLIFGLARGLIFVCLGYIALAWMLPSGKDRPRWFADARSIPYLDAGAGKLRSFVPLPRNASTPHTASSGSASNSAEKEAESAINAFHV